MDKSVVSAAEMLLRRHGAEAWKQSAGTSDHGPAENWLILAEERADIAQQVQACEGARQICVVTGNAGNAELIRAMLGGDSREIRRACGNPVYTSGDLDRCMEDLGFGYLDSAECPEKTDHVCEDALLDRELDQVLAAHGRDRFLIRLYEKREVSGGVQPFLSVIIRTQGRRMEALEEALLCLAGQSDQDFEVLLMLHRVEKAAETAVRSLVDSQTMEMRRKIRIIPVERAGRCAPVNEGIRLSRGQFFSVFDDDDLLLPEWVEHFRTGSQSFPGSVIHQYAVSQEWESLPSGSGQMLRAVSGLNNQFCKPFDMMLQARANSCPLMTLAFPSRLRNLEIFFDESLDVCEDWEYLMRTSAFLGVQDVKEPGAIYRMWKNAGNSHTVHDEQFWRSTEEKIRSRHDARPLMMGEGSVAEFVRIDRLKDAARYVFEPVLYPDRGSGFREEEADHRRLAMYLDDFSLVYDVDNVRRVRWDPVPADTVAVKELKLEAVDADGQVREAEVEWTNARLFPGFWFFDLPDPQMIMKLPEHTKQLRISGRLQHHFTGSDMTVMRGRFGATAIRHKLKVRLHALKMRLRR